MSPLGTKREFSQERLKGRKPPHCRPPSPSVGFLQAVYCDPAVPLETRIMAAGRALRVEKPALSASHSVSEVNVNLATRLEAARKRVAEMRRGGFGAEIGTALEPPAQIIDVSPDGRQRV